MIRNLAIYNFVLLSLVIFLTSCGGSSGSDDPDNNDQKQIPGKANAFLPGNGEPCSLFEDVLGEESKALIFFEWSTSSNTNSYRIQIFDGGSQVASNTQSTTETEFILDRGKTYTWTITSINSDGETVSDTFSFTSPGIPIGNYAPYAAEISVDFNTVNIEMDIFWTGSDEDGDPLTYDVQIFQQGISIDSYEDLTDTSLPALPYQPGDHYEIRVTSNDDAGNFSISIFEIEAPE